MMHRILLIGALLFVSTYISLPNANAHSGRTDSSGGHNCSSKSISKGLCTGYHYHNGGGPTSTPHNDSNNENNKPFVAPVESGPTKEEIELQDIEKGSSDGEKAGYEQGYKSLDSYPEPSAGSEAYKRGYRTGYESGYKKGMDKNIEVNKAKYTKAGYNDAFLEPTYKVKEFEKEEYEDWYKEGFESNEEVDIIQEYAYQRGVNGEEYGIPDKYKHAAPIYEHYYNLGLQEYEEFDGVLRYFIMIYILPVAWAIRRIFVVSQMIKK